MTEDRRQRSEGRRPIHSVQDLVVYKRSYDLAIALFVASKVFPKQETYALTDQLRRASRSIPANIREGFAKRKYPNLFIRHLYDAFGSCEETRTWLDFAKDCDYLKDGQYEELRRQFDELSAMLYGLIRNWRSL